MSYRTLALALVAAVLPGCGSSDQTPATQKKPIHVSGDAFSFELPGTPYGHIGGAALGVVEAPDVQTTTTADGHFDLDGLSSGETATFTLTAQGFPAAQTKTFALPATDLERVTFQVPNDTLFKLLAGVLKLTVDPAACQMVSTVTRVGKSIYDAGAHGEAGATVSIDPPLPAANGPIYFGSNVIPDPTLTETSDDGGVVFVNVPPGEYTLTAHKTGVSFEAIRMTCRPNVLVNASPPFGLQALP